MASNKATLTLLFETGDVPQGGDYANLIDSCVNLAETSAQNMAGSLITTELITPRVSAANLGVTGLITVGNLSVAGVVSASSIISTLSVTGFGLISTGGARVATDVSADAGTVYASAIRTQNGVYESVGIVSAAGTAQGTAAPLIYTINRGKGVSDGATTGFVIPANRTGLTQVIVNDAASANLWPPTGGQINALSANTPFAMAANIPYEIYHITSSAYAVK